MGGWVEGEREGVQEGGGYDMIYDEVHWCQGACIILRVTWVVVLSKIERGDGRGGYVFSSNSAYSDE